MQALKSLLPCDIFCSFFSCALGKKLYEQQRDQLARGL